MKQNLFFSMILASIVSLGVLLSKEQSKDTVQTVSSAHQDVKAAVVAPRVRSKKLPAFYEIPPKKHVFQSFNNCGPATLSMALSYWNIDISQQELGQKLRPYQVPNGDNDDKSVTFEEFVAEVPNYNLIAYHRPNGTLELVKKLTTNGFPIIIRTWLHPGEDIGHFRLIRGYDDRTSEIIQDDSYQGLNLRFSYATLSDLWQPFNYEYVVLTNKDKEPLLKAILGTQLSEKTAWEDALRRAKKEEVKEGEIPYSLFNQAVANYHLGNYEETVLIYEQIKHQMPPRMLWYQIEPIQALAKIARYDEALEVIDMILNSNNRAFTELYLIQGEIYKKQGKRADAKAAFQKAVFYNRNSKTAQSALDSLE